MRAEASFGVELFAKEFLIFNSWFHLFTVHVVPKLLYHSPFTPSTHLLTTLFGLRGNFDQPPSPPPIVRGVRCHNMSPWLTPQVGIWHTCLLGGGFREKRFHKSSPHKGPPPPSNKYGFRSKLVVGKDCVIILAITCQFQPSLRYV